MDTRLEVMGSNPVEAAGNFQMSIRDNCLKLPK